MTSNSKTIPTLLTFNSSSVTMLHTLTPLGKWDFGNSSFQWMNEEQQPPSTTARSLNHDGSLQPSGNLVRHNLLEAPKKMQQISFCYNLLSVLLVLYHYLVSTDNWHVCKCCIGLTESTLSIRKVFLLSIGSR